MSWGLASLIILTGALAAGFAWYERTNPTSRMLALVATLAALAAIGRVAFAPLPNIKPTSDIVLLAGFALGGAPGFVIGAVAALASNLVFGQGPWTPWQMVAWGLCGLIGAGLGRVTHRRAGRIPLAVTCGVAGLVFGAIMDASIWATYGGQQTLAQYVVISGTSLPFNVAHAVGNVLFCLAFGPALVRALMRYRARMVPRWVDVPAAGSRATGAGAPLAAIALAAVLAAGLVAPGAAHAATAGQRAASYLVRTQNADGGWGAAPGQASSQVQTAWSVVGLAAAGRNPSATRRSGRSGVTVLRAGASRMHDIGDIERTIIALTAARSSTRTLVARLRGRQLGDGSFDRLVNRTAFGIVALRGAGASTGDRAIRGATAWLLRQQNADGGFNFASRGGPSGSDDTAAAMQALAAAGRRSTRAMRRAAAFLAARQNPDGGYALQPPGRSNAQSTAFVVQALLAAGRDPERQRRRGARSPLGYLRSLQGADGSVRYSRTSAQTPIWVTAQAVAALYRRPLPLQPGR